MSFHRAFFDELQKLAEKRVVTPEDLKLRDLLDQVTFKATGGTHTGGSANLGVDRRTTLSPKLTRRSGIQSPPPPPHLQAPFEIKATPPPTPKVNPGSPF